MNGHIHMKYLNRLIFQENQEIYCTNCYLLQKLRLPQKLWVTKLMSHDNNLLTVTSYLCCFTQALSTKWFLVMFSKCINNWHFSRYLKNRSSNQVFLSIFRTSYHLTLCQPTENIIVCSWSLKTVWTQIRPDKMSGLIWIQTVWHWWFSWKNFLKKLDFWKKSANDRKNHEKLPSKQRVNPSSGNQSIADIMCYLFFIYRVHKLAWPCSPVYYVQTELRPESLFHKYPIHLTWFTQSKAWIYPVLKQSSLKSQLIRIHTVFHSVHWNHASNQGKVQYIKISSKIRVTGTAGSPSNDNKRFFFIFCWLRKNLDPVNILI